MNAELINEIIRYLMSKPYNEVYELMDKVRKAIEEVQTEEVIKEEAS